MAFLFETANDIVIGGIIIAFYTAPIIVVAYLIKKTANAIERQLGMRS
jgi:hypothetical protein